MIVFATVGTRLEPFDRFVAALDEAIDRLAAGGADRAGRSADVGVHPGELLDDATPSSATGDRRAISAVRGLLQRGTCTRSSRHLETVDYLPRDEFRRWTERADVVVSHAGVGAIRLALDAGHRPLVMARHKAEGEVLNDHQTEIVDELERKGLLRSFSDGRSLAELLQSEPSRSHGAAARRAPLPTEILDALGRGSKRRHPWRVGRALLGLIALPGPRLDRLRVRSDER